MRSSRLRKRTFVALPRTFAFSFWAVYTYATRCNDTRHGPSQSQHPRNSPDAAGFRAARTAALPYLAEVERGVLRLVHALNLQQRRVADLCAHGTLVAHNDPAGVETGRARDGAV